MNYSKSGSGKPIVFLHGWGGSWQSWSPVIPVFAKRHVVYAVDLPGFGLSAITKPHGLVDYANELASFFKKNKLSKAVVVGHSFGGQVAAKFALLYPNFVSKLVLVDAAISRDNTTKTTADIALAKLGKKILANSVVKNWLPQFRKWYYKMRRLDESDYFVIHDQNLQSTASKIFREDLMESISRIDLPTLIFWGIDDEATPLAQGKAINETIKNSRLIVVPGGHFSYLDNLDKFTKSVEEFLK